MTTHQRIGLPVFKQKIEARDEELSLNLKNLQYLYKICHSTPFLETVMLAIFHCCELL